MTRAELGTGKLFVRVLNSKKNSYPHCSTSEIICLPVQIYKKHGIFVEERGISAFETDEKVTILLGAQNMYHLSGQLLKYLDNFKSKCLVDGGQASIHSL